MSLIIYQITGSVTVLLHFQKYQLIFRGIDCWFFKSITLFRPGGIHC